MDYKNYEDSFKNLKNVIETNKKFVISSHINLDGDAIGSEIAMYNLLKDLGKEVYIVNSSITPDNCLFLHGANEILEHGHIGLHEKQLIKKADVLIILDVNEIKRVGVIVDILEKSSPYTVCIDHHVLSDPLMNLSIIKEDASATGEILYKFIKYAGYTITLNIAEALYISILTDTGSFQHANTNVESHLIAAELISMGLNHSYIYESYYCNQPLRKAMLFISVISTLQTECDGKIAWMKMTREMLKMTNAKSQDSDGIINFALNIKGVKIILFFKELVNGKVKVSLRSRKSINVRSIATAFGGGGHKNASGVLMKGTLDDVIQKLMPKVQNSFLNQ